MYIKSTYFGILTNASCIWSSTTWILLISTSSDNSWLKCPSFIAIGSADIRMSTFCTLISSSYVFETTSAPFNVNWILKLKKLGLDTFKFLPSILLSSLLSTDTVKFIVIFHTDDINRHNRYYSMLLFKTYKLYTITVIAF